MDLELWKKKRKELNLRYEDLAQKAGISKRSVEDIFRGYTTKPRIDTVESIERALGLNQPQIQKDPVIKDKVELNDMYPVPLLGSVVAGLPIEAQEDLEGYIYISFRPKEEYFALRVHGDSMINAGIQDGSILVVHKQETAENGEVVVAMLNGEQTVKRLKLVGEMTFLWPENNAYEPIPVSAKDSFIILGRVVEVRFSLK